MNCFIYRSGKQEQMYLYLREKDQFSVLPTELLTRFGKSEFVMELDLSKREKLARENIDQVRTALLERGFYLQLPQQFEGHLHDGD